MANVGTLSIKFTGDAKQLEDTFTRVGVKANLISSAITTAFQVAARATVNYVKDSISAYDQDAKAQSSLLTALKGREDATDRLIQQASDLQKITLFGDETTVQAQAFLAQMGLTEDAIKRVTPLVQDFASAQNVDLGTAAKLVAKSLGSSTNALSRYGIEIKGTVGSSERLESAVNSLSAAFGGQAEAAAKAGSGPLVQFQNAMSDIQELVGAVVGPALQEAARQMTAFAERVKDAAGGDVLLKLQAGLLTAVKSIGLFAEAFRNSIGPIIGVYRGLEAVQLALELKFRQAAEKAGQAVDEFAKPFKNLFNLQNSVREVIDTYNTSLDQLKNKTESTTPAVIGLGDGFEGTGKKTKSATDELLKFITAQEAATIRLVELAREREAIEKKLAEANIGPRVQLLDKAAQQPLSLAPQDELTRSGDVAEIDARALAIQKEAEAYKKLSDELKGIAADYTNLEEPILAHLKTLETSSQVQEAINKSTSLFASTLLSVADATANYAKSGGSSLKEFAKVAAQSAKENIGNFIREGVAGAVSKALSGLPFPLNIAAGGIAGALAQTLFNKLISNIKIPAFGDGGVVLGPTLALIGEKGPERITPLRAGVGDSNSVTIKGVQYGADTYWQNANIGIVGRLVYGPQ